MNNFRCKICGEEFETLPMVCPTPGCGNRNPVLWENIAPPAPKPMLTDEEQRELEAEEKARKLEQQRYAAEQAMIRQEHQLIQQAGGFNGFGNTANSMPFNAHNAKPKKKVLINVLAIIILLLVLILAGFFMWLKFVKKSDIPDNFSKHSITKDPDTDPYEAAKELYRCSNEAVYIMEAEGFDLDDAAIFSKSSKNLYDSFFDLDTFNNYVADSLDNTKLEGIDDADGFFHKYDYVIVLDGDDVLFVAVAEGYNKQSAIYTLDYESMSGFKGLTLDEIWEILAEDISSATENSMGESETVTDKKTNDQTTTTPKTTTTEATTTTSLPENDDVILPTLIFNAQKTDSQVKLMFDAKPKEVILPDNAENIEIQMYYLSSSNSDEVVPDFDELIPTGVTYLRNYIITTSWTVEIDDNDVTIFGAFKVEYDIGDTHYTIKSPIHSVALIDD